LQSVGKDDDGDCEHPEAGEMITDSQKDTNEDGIPCNIQIRLSEISGNFVISSDIGVDEDPDENEYFHEAMHRAFIIGFGKVGFVLLIGIFLPLFLATGLIRQEMENETLHYLVSKPIHRAEVLIYRLLGFLAIAIPYIAILVILSALVVGFAAPGDSFFRIQDLGIWLGIMLASWLMVIVYGAVFMVFGMVHRFGMIAAIILGVWEFVLAMITLADPSLFIARLSVVFWGMTIVDACATMIYPNTPLLIAQGRSISGSDGFSPLTGYIWTPNNLPGTEALNSFWNSPSLGFSPFITLLISVFVLLAMVVSMLFIGQAIFKGKEIS
ncbi:ABC transporter permease, partial [Deltaproteobacteria bacterium]|nr:ABC transporter permease [Deltaproteobacteria bacterium]